MATLAPVWDEAAGEGGDRPHGPDFRALVGEHGWAQLPLAVRARFAYAAEATYAGTMAVRASTFGRIIAHLCRPVGTPVAPWTGEAVPVSVRVWVDPRGGLVWDRTYDFPGRAPLLVTSRKLVTERGALLEIARGGLGMSLEASVEDDVLHFRSTGYFWSLLGLRLPIPAWITPGAADVIHRDEGGGRFTFAMRFVHPLFGESLFQSGTFEDPT